jgi:aminotransferase
VTLAGGTAIPVPCEVANQFKLNPDSLAERITPKSKVIVMNYPNNPTGAIMTRTDYKAIADIIIDHDLLVINDEVYSELTYSGKHTAIATIDGLHERTITLNGFSKAYSMTGWRVGYLCAPKLLSEAALKIHQYVMLCAPTMGQMAAMEALRNGEEDKKRMVNEYKLRRNFFIDGLAKNGIPCHMPEGAFYAFPNISGVYGKSWNGKKITNSTEFTEFLLENAKVGVVPGIAFGDDRCVRLSYATSMETITKGLDRIESAIKTP